MLNSNKFFISDKFFKSDEVSKLRKSNSRRLSLSFFYRNKPNNIINIISNFFIHYNNPLKELLSSLYFWFSGVLCLVEIVIRKVYSNKKINSIFNLLIEKIKFRL